MHSSFLFDPGMESIPGGQSVHFLDLVLFPYVFALHSEQFVLVSLPSGRTLSGLKCPAVHHLQSGDDCADALPTNSPPVHVDTLHTDEPLLLAYFPETQGVQAVCLGALVNLPAIHDMHSDWSPSL